jgi:hypothetical protein
MSDDHGHFEAETGPWPMGWALALGAGVVAALLAAAIGGATGAGALVIGLLSFAVFGALLGAGGVERASEGDAQGDHHHNLGGHH